MITANIAKATYVSGHMEYTVETPFGALFAVSSDVDQPFVVGQEMALSFSGPGPVSLPQKLMLLSFNARQLPSKNTLKSAIEILSR